MTSPEDVVAEKKENVQAFAGEADSIESFMGFVHNAESGGALDAKTKELMSLALGVTLRCEDCIVWHLDAALEAGATEAEIVEALEIAVVMGGGPALMYATEAYETLQDFDT
ncbi:carboxymuconolactone decarboxylase family protein [Halapricum desulfuricans]|uniref:carboxymuconolactone decarboxylase family protein n=1 Tax=Halapricum desulfuricans TaxID=2841257 RepID=UPI001E351FC8|nr:carboxymuconolactone decarboxylase family protein [Halapricum desulfuricans]